jgi:hypothetical protein
MRIWTIPFLLLFLGAAAALSLLVVIYSLPTWLTWPILGLEVAACLVGGWLMCSRLLRAGFFLQVLLAASSLLVLIPALRSTPFIASPASFLLSTVIDLLGVTVFLCLSYGIAPWRTPLDIWLTILQVALAGGISASLVNGFPFVTPLPNSLGQFIGLGISLACQFFVVLLLLLRGACWKRAPFAVALLLVGRMFGLAQAVLPFVMYRLTFLHNISIINALFYVERAAFPLFFLGLLVLIQTWRVHSPMRLTESASCSWWYPLPLTWRDQPEPEELPSPEHG